VSQSVPDQSIFYVSLSVGRVVAPFNKKIKAASAFELQL
jgi:hypothetical protein